MNHAEVYTIKYPTGLKVADDVVDDLPITKERLLELADARMCPHWRIDGGEPLFQKSEIKTWIANNILERIEGERSMPIQLRIVHSPKKLIIEEPPSSISLMKEHLTQVNTADWVPGVYFLCHSDEVVYVGQSVTPLSRIQTHHNDTKKNFDRAYFIPVPKTDLDDVEGAFIRFLKPKLNGRIGGFSGNKTISAPKGNTHISDDEVIDRYMNIDNGKQESA